METAVLGIVATLVASALFVPFAWVKQDLRSLRDDIRDSRKDLREDIGDLRKDVGELQQTISSWRVFIEALVGPLTKEVVGRMFEDAHDNPAANTELVALPESVRKDAKQALLARGTEGVAGKEDIEQAVLHLIRKQWGIERSAEIAQELGITAEELIERVARYLRDAQR